MTEKYPETLNAVRALFGKNLRRIRISKNLFQKEVGDLFGVKANHIYAMEKGEYSPSVRNICVLANCLEVPVEEFFKNCEAVTYRDQSVRASRLKRYA